MFHEISDNHTCGSTHSCNTMDNNLNFRTIGTLVLSNALWMNYTHSSKCKEMSKVYLSSPGMYLYNGTKWVGCETTYPLAQDRMAPILSSEMKTKLLFTVAGFSAA